MQTNFLQFTQKSCVDARCLEFHKGDPKAASIPTCENVVHFQKLKKKKSQFCTSPMGEILVSLHCENKVARGKCSILKRQLIFVYCTINAEIDCVVQVLSFAQSTCQKKIFCSGKFSLHFQQSLKAELQRHLYIDQRTSRIVLSRPFSAPASRFSYSASVLVSRNAYWGSNDSSSSRTSRAIVVAKAFTFTACASMVSSSFYLDTTQNITGKTKLGIKNHSCRKIDFLHNTYSSNCILMLKPHRHQKLLERRYHNG